MNGSWKKNRKYTVILAIQVVELMLVVLSLISSFMLAGFLIYNSFFPYGVFIGIVFSSMASGVAIIILASNRYFNFETLTFAGMAVKVIWIVFVSNFILVIMLYFENSLRLSPYFFITAGALQVGLLLIIKLVTGVMKRHIICRKMSLIIGEKKDESGLLTSLRKHCGNKLTYVDVNGEDITDYIDKAESTYLVSNCPAEQREAIVSYCELHNKRLYIIPGIHEIAMRNSEMTQLKDIPLFSIEGFRLSEAQVMVKRGMDVVLSLIGSLMTLPLVLFFALLIKAEDGGPVFYTQVRLGLNGRTFKIIKLRSMIVDAEKNTGSILAKENDPRITKVGRIIRAARIDEIPQFYNVFAGNMSIVGPRPERPEFAKRFEALLPEYLQRLAVKPGITGLAQVLANYTTTPENKLKFDLIYIRKYSPLLDIKIIFKTMKVIFLKNQAKGFSMNEGEFSFNSTGEEVECHLPFAEGTVKQKSHNGLKASLIAFCCLLVVGASVTMRYGFLVDTLLEANDQLLEMGQEQTSEIIDDGEVPMGNFPESVLLLKNEFSATFTYLTFEERIQIEWQMITKMETNDLMVLEKLSENGLNANETLIVKQVMARNFNEAEQMKMKELLAEK